MQFNSAVVFSIWLLAISALLALALALLPGFEFAEPSVYLAAHTCLELIAVVIAALIFTVGWHTHLGRGSCRTVAVACLFLGVALLDLSHVLSYEGMPDFITPSGANKTIGFWFAARTLAALAIVATFTLPASTVSGRCRYILLSIVAVTVTAVHGLIFYFPQSIPHFFDNQTGLSATKLIFEYLLVIPLSLSAVFLWKEGVKNKRIDTLNLAVAAAFMVLSELFFTQYNTLTDSYNLFGHVFKLIAYYYLFKAFVSTEFMLPFQYLAASNARLQATLNAIPDLMFELKPDGTIVNYHSSTDQSELLASPGVFLGRPLQEFLPTKVMEVVNQAIKEIDTNKKTSGLSYSLNLGDEEHFYDISGAKILSEDDDSNYLLMVRNVSKQRKNEEELRILAVAFASQESIVITNPELRILRVNAAFEKSTGYTQAEIEGKTPAVLKSNLHDESFYRSMWNSIKTTGSWRGEIHNRRKNGETWPQLATITAVHSAQGAVTHYISSYIDRSEIHEAQKVIKKLAYFDSLTGLINRSGLLGELQSNVKQSLERKLFGALLIVDLDNFRVINDTLGHQAGDELLIEVAERLQALVGSRGIVSRYGGDEFVVVLPDLHEDTGTAAITAEDFAQLVTTRITGTYQLSKTQHYCSCSIGVTAFGEGASNNIELIKQMDIALLKAKEDGGNSIRFFDRIWQKSVSERASLLADLREAILEHQFVLYYQPQCDAYGKVIGAEALVRWHHPRRGLVAPNDFIPFAEQNGLMLAIGREVVELGVSKLHAWQKLPRCKHLKLSINLVAEQIYEEGFADALKSRIQQWGIDTRLLMFEFTESTLMENLDLARENITKLSDVGVQFAIDDFGTGYSSLTYLSQLPWNLLKIDQSFVSNIGLKDKDEAIVRTVINMADSLDLQVLAEGVETEGQRRFLLDHGCAFFQGYLTGRPVPASKFESDRAASG